MIRFFRNMAVRLWLSVLMGIPLAFWLITPMASRFNGYGALIWLILVLAVFYVSMGFLMNRAGIYWVKGLIREAETWERAGILHRSRRNYISALRVFDSFLFSPLGAGALEDRIAGAVARFALSFSKSGPPFDRAVRFFIRRNPHERDIVLDWLSDIGRRQPLTPEDQALITRLADNYGDDPEILPLLAGCFAGQGREDFAAKKLYEKTLTQKLGEPELERSLRKLLDADLLPLGKRYPAPEQAVTMPRQERFAGLISTLSGWSVLALKALWPALKKGSIAAVGFIAAIIRSLGQTEKNRRRLKWGVLVVLGCGLMLILISTLTRFSRVTPPSPGRAGIEIPVPKPFTIQVAAYLKKRHADAYVALLKKKGLDAFIHQVDGGGKSWFLVRISSFPDKAEAERYGRKLKSDGLIEDFFVDNNES